LEFFEPAAVFYPIPEERSLGYAGKDG